jgi:hypothetical protein
MKYLWKVFIAGMRGCRVFFEGEEGALSHGQLFEGPTSGSLVPWS